MAPGPSYGPIITAGSESVWGVLMAAEGEANCYRCASIAGWVRDIGRTLGRLGSVVMVNNRWPFYPSLFPSLRLSSSGSFFFRFFPMIYGPVQWRRRCVCVYCRLPINSRFDAGFGCCCCCCCCCCGHANHLASFPNVPVSYYYHHLWIFRPGSPQSHHISRLIQFQSPVDGH